MLSRVSAAADASGKIFDAHLHVIDPRFPLVANRGYLPPPFPTESYRARAERLGVVGGAVVSGSFQGDDQSYLRAALAELGPSFVGVTQLSPDVSDAEILDLDRIGVRAVRFNLVRGGPVLAGDLEQLAARVHALAGWHVEIYAAPAALAELAPRLATLPAIVVDHLGLAEAARPTLRALVAQGARVKASGFGRLDFDPLPAIRELLEIDPRSVVFGTDLPSTRAPRPFRDEDLLSIRASLRNDLADRVLYRNGVELYRPSLLP
jgi:predicted TIM-barrel fold metal-dependent hydrolase